MSDMKLSEAPMRLPSVVTIPRDKWIEGDYGDTSEGHCAMGWLAFEATGQHYLDTDDAPPDADEAALDFVIECSYAFGGWHFSVTEANDRIRDASKRESRLRELFAERGIQLRFVGEYKSEAQSSALVPRSAENIMEKVGYGDQLILGAKA